MRASYRVSRLRTYSNAFLACAILCGGAVVFALTAPFFQTKTLAEVTPPASPTIATEAPTGGGGIWNDDSDIHNIFLSDDIGAYTKMMQPGDFSGSLRATGFDFSQIPSTAVILGIEVHIERRASATGALTDRAVRLFSSNGVSLDNKADTTITWPDSDEVKTYGGATDLWGNLWTVDDVKSSFFTVILAAQNSNGSDEARAGVDHISVSVTYADSADQTRPSVTVTSLISNPTPFSPIPFEVVFSEPVTDFTDSDIAFSGGSLHDFVAVSESRYTFMISPGADPSPISINVQEAVANDLAGNTNTASNTATITYDSTAPEIIITSGPSQGSLLTTGQAAFAFTTSGEFAACAIDIEPLIGSNDCTTFSGGIGSHEFSAIPDGTHTIYIKAATSGRESLMRRDLTIDTQRPTVQLASIGVINGWASTTPIQFTVQFSDPVVRFDNLVSDVTVSGGTLSSLMGSGATYAFRVQTVSAPSVSVNIPAGAAIEANGSGWGNESASLTFSFDSVTPSLTFENSIEDGVATSSNDFSFPFTASDNVSVIVSCSLDGVATTSPCMSPYSTGPIADGYHTVHIEAVDPAGNATSSSRTFAVDATPPVLSEVHSIGSTTDTTPDYTFASTEEGSLTVGGSCSASAMSVASGTTTFTLSELERGTYDDCTITVTDALGNTSAPLSVTPFTIRNPDPAPATVGGNGPPTFTGSPTAPVIVVSEPIGQVLGTSTMSTSHRAEQYTQLPNPSREIARTPSTTSQKSPVIIELIESTSTQPSMADEYTTSTFTQSNSIERQDNSPETQAAAVTYSGSAMPGWMYAVFAIALLFMAWKLLRVIFN